MWNSAARAQRDGRTLKNKNISRKEALWQCLESLHAVPLDFVHLSYCYIPPLSFVFIPFSQRIRVLFTSRLTLFLALFLRCLLDRSTACGHSCWRGSGSRSCTWRKGKTYGTLIRADNVFKRAAISDPTRRTKYCMHSRKVKEQRHYNENPSTWKGRAGLNQSDMQENGRKPSTNTKFHPKI